MCMRVLADRARQILLLVALALVGDAHAADNAGRTWPTGGWQRGTPAEVGLDESALAAIDKDLASGKYSLVDSFQVFRCGAEVYSRRYDHDYGKLYSKEARTKGPLNARLSGRYNYYDPAWHPFSRPRG